MRSTAWLSGFLTRQLVHPYWLVPVTSTCVVSRNSEHSTWFPSKQRTEDCEKPTVVLSYHPLQTTSIKNKNSRVTFHEIYHKVKCLHAV